MNKIAYGYLSNEEIKSLFTEPCSRLPITYGPQPCTRQDVLQMRGEINSFFDDSSSVSISSIRKLINNVLENFKSRYAYAQLLSFITSLDNQVMYRENEWLLVPYEDKNELEEGLSPIFSTEELQPFYHFVDTLNNRNSLQNVHGKADKHEVLTLAISYKHHSTSNVKLSSSHLAELKDAVPMLASEVGVSKFQIWIDRILSAKKPSGDRSWWEIGLAPFLQLPVLYVSGEDRSDEKLAQEMDTMWINIERVAASIGVGMVSYGRRFDQQHFLPLKGIVFEITRNSRFDWWASYPINGTLDHRMKALLFAMGNTTLLDRPTYFQRDRELLLEAAAETYSTPRAVISVRPPLSLAMRDSLQWNTREGLSWVGRNEWLVNFCDEELEDDGNSILDAASVLGDEAEFRYFGICSQEGSKPEPWVMVCQKTRDPSVALAVEVLGNKVGLRATVALDNAAEFLDMTKMDNYDCTLTNHDQKLRIVSRMLTACGVLNEGEILCSFRQLEESDPILRKKFD